jgi:hypothetical protein
MFMNKGKAAGVAVLVLAAGAAGMAYQASQGVSARFQAAPTSQAQSPSTPSNDVTDWVAGWPDLAITPENDPNNKAILAALQKPIPMHFPKPTPLSEVITYVRNATEGPGLPKGIIIYVDPIGMQDADKTTADTVTIDLEEVPLKTALRLILRQLSLRYEVEDGVLTITTTGCYPDGTAFEGMYDKARRGELTREQYKQLIEALKLWRQVESLMKDGSVENNQLGGLGGANPAGDSKPGGFR